MGVRVFPIAGEIWQHLADQTYDHVKTDVYCIWAGKPHFAGLQGNEIRNAAYLYAFSCRALITISYWTWSFDVRALDSGKRRC